MFGANGIIPAFIITIICTVIAGGAVALVIASVILWIQRRRKLALWMGIPALLYLTVFLWLFAPRPLPRRTITIDLSHPTDLSGFPEDTVWHSGLTIEKFAGFVGILHVHVTLPSGTVIDDTIREISVNRDDEGIFMVHCASFPTPPAVVTSANAARLAILLDQCTNRSTADRLLSDITQRIATYDPKDSSLTGYVPFEFGTWSVNYGIYIPNSEVTYSFTIERPHTMQPKE